MGTDLGVYCETCHVKGCERARNRLIIDNLRGDKNAQSLVTHAPFLASLYRWSLDSASELTASASFYDSPSMRVDLSFFFVHEGHKLVAIDEYGGRIPSCKKGDRAPIWCRLEDEHKGSCDGRGVFDR